MKRHTVFLAITALLTVSVSMGCGQKSRLSANNLYSSELLEQISNGALVPISFADDGVRAIDGRPSQERSSYLVSSGIQPGTYEMVFNGEEMHDYYYMSFSVDGVRLDFDDGRNDLSGMGTAAQCNDDSCSSWGLAECRNTYIGQTFNVTWDYLPSVTHCCEGGMTPHLGLFPSVISVEPIHQ